MSNLKLINGRSFCEEVLEYDESKENIDNQVCSENSIPEHKTSPLPALKVRKIMESDRHRRPQTNSWSHSKRIFLLNAATNWSFKEDKNLKNLVAKVGQNWELIAQKYSFHFDLNVPKNAGALELRWKQLKGVTM